MMQIIFELAKSINLDEEWEDDTKSDIVTYCSKKTKSKKIQQKN
jgi:hypothetical protein